MEYEVETPDAEQTYPLTTLHSGRIVVGNIFSASLMMMGHSFEDPKEWDRFAGTKIRAWLGGAK